MASFFSPDEQTRRMVWQLEANPDQFATIWSKNPEFAKSIGLPTPDEYAKMRNTSAAPATTGPGTDVGTVTPGAGGISVTPPAGGGVTTGIVGAPGNGWDSVGTGTADAYLRQLLATGTSGQQAADLVNARFPGVVQYYQNFKGSGHNVYGLPNGYVTNEGGGWNYTTRGNESGGSNSTLSNLGGSAGNFNPQISAFTPQTYTPTPFTAPTLADLQAEPGIQYGLDSRQRLLTNGYAAKGTLLNGRTVQALGQDAQDYASTKYGDVYNRALSANQANNGYNLSAAQTNNSSGLAANQNNYNQALTTNQTNYSQLYNLANLGLTATNSTYS